MTPGCSTIGENGRSGPGPAGTSITAMKHACLARGRRVRGFLARPVSTVFELSGAPLAHVCVSALPACNCALAAGLVRRLFGDEGDSAFDAFGEAVTLTDQHAWPARMRCT